MQSMGHQPQDHLGTQILGPMAERLTQTLGGGPTKWASASSPSDKLEDPAAGRFARGRMRPPPPHHWFGSRCCHKGTGAPATLGCTDTSLQVV